jgi:hypothetical protein
MTARIVQSFKTNNPNTFVYLYRDSEWQEWQVTIHKKSDPRYREGPTSYHGDDKQEALDSAAYVVQWLANQCPQIAPQCSNNDLGKYVI